MRPAQALGRGGLFLAGLTTANLVLAQAELNADLRLGADQHSGFFSRQGERSAQAYLRELSVGIDYQATQNWDFELEWEWQRLHGEDEFSAGDARLDYTGFKSARLSLGRMKEPFGMERLMSAAALMMPERAVATSAITPGRAYGLQAGRRAKHWTWQLGVFQEESQSSDATRAVSGRLTRVLWQATEYTLHMGVSFSQRWHRGDAYQVREQAELFSADNIVRSPRLAADSRALGGVELAWLYRQWFLSAEHFAQQINDDFDVNWRFNGQYVQLGYLMRGQTRRYKHGLIKAPQAADPWGAWELALRVGQLDARDHGYGSVTRLSSIALNVWLPQVHKFALAFSHAELRGDQRSPENTGEALSLRWQMGF